MFRVMTRTIRVSTLLGVLLAAGCATTAPVPPVRHDIADLPMLETLRYQADRSVVIESPTVRAARLLYRGRVEPGSLAVETQRALEAAGWRLVSATSMPGPGTTQVYERGDAYLQVRIWEGGLFGYYTYLELSRTQPAARSATR